MTPRIQATTTWGRIRLGLHLLAAVLMLVLLVRAFGDDGAGWPLAGAAVATTAVYLGGLSHRVVSGRVQALAWLAVLVCCWLGMLWLAPESVYLAFPLYFLAAHLLPDGQAVGAVAVLCALAIGGYAVHEGFSFGGALGPVLGGLVAVATVAGIRAVRRESARRGVLEERERLAREVHDTLTQGLSSINLLLGAAAERLPADPAAAQAAGLVRQARRVAVDNLEEARRFVRGLAPPALDAAPLTEAVRGVVDAVPHASLVVSGTVRNLPARYDVALLRVAQEALANAERHARAGRIVATLSYLRDAVALDVVDDGVGFDPAAAHAGYGLTSMRTRAESLAGRLDVESAPGEGTRVALRLPVPAGEARR